MKGLRILLKIGAVFLGLFLLALALLPFVLKKYLPPEKVRALIAANAQKALKRELRLGDVSWSLIKGLSVKDLAISESPDFKAGSFAEMRSFSLRVQWLPLLRRKIVLDSVSVEGLRLSLFKKPDGQFNFSDLAGSSAPPTSQAPQGGLPVELAVSRADVSDSKVVYKDALTGDQWELSRVNAKVRNLRLDRPFAAEASLEIAGRTGGRPVSAAISYAGKVNLGGQDPGKMAFDIKRLAVDHAGLRLEASGRLEGMKAPKADIKVALAARQTRILEAEFAGGVWLPGPQSPPALKGEFKVKTPGFKAAELEALKPWGLPKGLEKTVVPPVKASGKLDWNPDALEFKALKVEFRGGALEASGKVLALRSQRPEPDLAVSASVSLPELRSADLAFLKSFKIEVPPDLQAPPADISARLRLKGGDLALETLRLKSRGVLVEASGTIKKMLSPKPDADLSASIKLDLPALKAKDLAALKLAKLAVPESAALPPMNVETRLDFKGEDLGIRSFKLKTGAGEAEVSGTVRKVLSAPDPEISFKAKFDLPAFASADVAFVPQVPPGLNIPASKVDVEFFGGLDSVDVKFLRLVAGNNNLALKGKLKRLKSGSPAFDVTMVCKSFVLEELTKFSTQTREMKLAGSGRFNLKVARNPPERAYYVGDLQFKGLGATVAGLALADFEGKGGFDEKTIDFPKIKGKVGEGNLDMDLTVKNYAKTPSLDIQQVSLDVFDLSQYLAAKASLAQKAPASAKPSEAPAAVPPVNFKCRSFDVGKLKYSNAAAESVHLAWDLTGITPDLKTLGGTAELHVGGGHFENLGKAAAPSPVVKVLILPFMVLQKISAVLGHRLFPDFNNVVFSEIAGKYEFENGRMKLVESRLESSVAHVETQGEIDLPTEKLRLLVFTKTQTIPPISLNVNVSGTISQPAAKLGVGKFLEDAARGLVEEPVKKVLDIFKK